jgi:hypothetical protein
LCPSPNTIAFPTTLQIWFCDPNKLLIKPKFMPMFQAFPSLPLSVFQSSQGKKAVHQSQLDFIGLLLHVPKSSRGQLKWLVMYKPMMILFNYVQNRYFLNSNIRKSLFYNVMYYENI